MSQDHLQAFEVIIPHGTTSGVITPARETLLQVRLSEALRDYILVISERTLAEEKRREYCRIQYNFEYRTSYHSASEEKSAARSYTQNVEQMAEVHVVITNGAK